MKDVEIEKVHFTQDRLGFELKDGRLISVPLSFYPTLRHASEAQRLSFEVYASSVTGPISIATLAWEECLLVRRSCQFTLRNHRHRAPLQWL